MARYPIISLVLAMNCLAIDTSTDHLSLALQHAGQTSLTHQQVGQKHAELALPAIQAMLQERQLALTDLDVIIHGKGPGSFTGLRIACGLAQGLAFACGLPVIGIPTLDSVAVQASGQVLVCLDARMQQIYHASYDTDNWVQPSPITLSNPEDLPANSTMLFGAGNGFSVYPSRFTPALLSSLHGLDSSLMPRADMMIRLAESGRYPATPANQASLLYIRNKVALTTGEQQARRA